MQSSYYKEEMLLARFREICVFVVSCQGRVCIEYSNGFKQIIIIIKELEPEILR